MSKSPLLDPSGSVEDLGDQELLERIANLDPEKYPLVPIVQAALGRQEGSE